MEINLTAGAAATYAIPANAISYLVGSNLYTAASGSIVVSANASAKITGTFTSSGSGASITSVSGTFTNIPIR